MAVLDVAGENSAVAVPGIVRVILRAMASALLAADVMLENWFSRDRRTDAEIRANPQPGDWWECSCGYRVPVWDDLKWHVCGEESVCPDCGCALARYLGGLEEHEPGCPRFPL